MDRIIGLSFMTLFEQYPRNSLFKWGIWGSKSGFGATIGNGDRYLLGGIGLMELGFLFL